MKKWNDENLESELRSYCDTLGYFPSTSELRECGRNDLSCAVSKYGGTLHWSEKLGISRRASDSDFGWKGEDAFVALCREQRLEAVRTSGVKFPWDITVADVLRVDAKNAKFKRHGRSSGWFYRIAKRPQADLVVLHQDDTGFFYGIPWWVCPSSNMTISVGGGKYVEFLNNWPLIRRMVGMRLAEASMVSGTKIEEVA